MSDDEKRDQDQRIAAVIGWKNLEYRWMGWSRDWIGTPPSAPSMPGGFEASRVPHYMTDPNASAILKRWIRAKGWSYQTGWAFGPGAQGIVSAGAISRDVWAETEEEALGSAFLLVAQERARRDADFLRRHEAGMEAAKAAQRKEGTE